MSKLKRKNDGTLRSIKTSESLRLIISWIAVGVLFTSPISCQAEEQKATSWHGNQVGYQTHAPKVLLLDGNPEGALPDKYFLYDSQKTSPLPFLKGKTVYKIKTVRVSPMTEDMEGPHLMVYALDFSD